MEKIFYGIITLDGKLDKILENPSFLETSPFGFLVESAHCSSIHLHVMQTHCKKIIWQTKISISCIKYWY